MDLPSLFFFAGLVLLTLVLVRGLQNATLFTTSESLDVVTGAGGPLEIVNATLFTTNISFNPTRTLAEFVAVKAAWAGSAAKVIVWSAKAIAPSGLPFKESQLLLWICTTAPVATVPCYGVYYDDGTALLGVDYFPAPVGVTSIGDAVQWIASAP